MDANNFEVDFETFCKTCKHKDIKEFKDPCNECLGNPVRESTCKPLNWED